MELGLYIIPEIRSKTGLNLIHIYSHFIDSGSNKNYYIYKV
jgi:hypothetical protein